MLTPYTPTSKALTKGKPAKKKIIQYNLWGSWSTRSKPAQKSDKTLESFKLHDLAALWTERVRTLEFEDVGRLELRCKELGLVVNKAVAGHYALLKTMTLKRPADVAVFFALRDLGMKAKKEEPTFEPQIIDLAIDQIVQG